MATVTRRWAETVSPGDAGGGGMLRWYVVETQPCKEALAVEHLARQAFSSFCPRFRRLRRHARRQETVLAPLFPGYVFVRFDVDSQPWRSINGTFGVRRLVGSENTRPRPMPEDVMQQILARCRNGIVTQLVDRLEPGRAVRIVSGPFAESFAEIESLDDKGRVRVLLDILGSACSIRVTPECLAPA